MSNEEGVSPSAPSTNDVAPSRSRSVGAIASLLIALLAGGTVWVIVFTIDPVFRISDEFAELPSPIPAETAEKLAVAVHQVDLQNGVLILGILGAVLGGGLACAEGVVRRSPGRAALGLTVGVGTAAVLGMVGAWLGEIVMSRYGHVDVDTGLNRTIFVQVAMLASLGLGVGLGVGLTSGIRRIFSASLAGVFGGISAALVYPILAAILLPNANTETGIPYGAINRLLWIGVVTALIGLTIGGLRFTQRGEK